MGYEYIECVRCENECAGEYALVKDLPVCPNCVEEGEGY